MNKGHYYTAVIQYDKNNEYVTGIDLGAALYQMTDGLLVREADGTLSILRAASDLNVGGASYVSMRPMDDAALASVSSVTNTNPNCLFILNDGAAIPSCLAGKNVVVGTSAENITIQEIGEYLIILLRIEGEREVQELP